MSEYNDIEHRAFFGLLPGCDLTAGGIKDIEVLTCTIIWPTKRKPTDGHPISKSWIDESEKVSKVKHKITFTINAPTQFPPGIKGNDGELFIQIAAKRGDKFILDRLKRDFTNTMPCPTCAMQCEKTHDGRIPNDKSRYEFFHCYNCKKNFKINL